MKKSIIYLLLSLFVFSGCNDENREFQKPEYGQQLTINFNLEIPELETAVTRAVEENTVSEVVVMVFDKTSSLLQQSVIVENIRGNNFSAKVVAQDNCDLYVVANANLLIQTLLNEKEEEVSLSDIEALTISELPATTIVMWGKETLVVDEEMSITLRRIVAKFTVGLEEEVTDFSIESFKIVNVAGKASILSDEESPESFFEGSTNTGYQENIHYTFPTQARSDIHLIIKGTYNGITGYYRLNLEARGEVIYPNYYYAVTITSVTGPGFVTEEEASKSLGDADMDYFIDAHSYITDMTTNGEYQLGIGDPATLGEKAGDEVIIKAVVINKAGLTPTAQVVSSGESNNPWFKIEASEGSFAGTTASGKVYEFTLQALSDNRTGKPRTGEIEISVGNLSKKLAVTQEAVNLQKDVNVIITTWGNAQNLMGENYWEFLEEAVGWGPQQMQGLIRDKGLHFPINDEEIGLEYKITIKNERYEYEYTNNSKYLEVSLTGNDIIVRLKSSAGETAHPRYGIEKDGLILKDVNNPDEAHTIYFDLYFTGIFRQGTGAFQITNKLLEYKYVYYEAVPFTINGKVVYWLDRNLCAASNAFYIKGKDGETVYGDPEAGGGIYKIAQKPVNHEVTLLNPGPCPPGFTIPTESDFSDIQSKMRYELNKEYFWETYLETDYVGKENLLEKIYFPKCLMWYDQGIKGTELTGYYWTQSKAIGVSGTERGYWLRYMQLGNSIQYNHFRIWCENKEHISEADEEDETKLNDHRTGMSLRCIKKTETQ